MKLGKALLLPLLWSAVEIAEPANAAVKAAVSVTAKAWRNTTTIAVQAVVKGDDDSTTICRIFQRQNGAAFDTGMVMQRRPTNQVTAATPYSQANPAVYEGRILWATAGDTIDYYVEAEDDSLGARQRVRSAVDTVSIARVPAWTAGGTEYYVNASPTLGSDANSGLTALLPKLTIGAAVTALAAANAPTGSTINIANGEYHESVVLSGGTNGRKYRLLGASRDSTIICGANEEVEGGNVAVGTPLAWTNTGQDSMYVAYFPSLGGPADSVQLIVLGFGEYIHRKTSLLAILNDSTLTSGCSSSTNEGELSGWAWQNDSLYVKRSGGASPSVTGNHFGYRDRPLWIKARNWYVSTLTVRYAGESRNGNTATGAAYKLANDGATCALANNCQEGVQNPGLNGHCVALGDGSIANSNAAGTVLYNLRLYGSSSALVYGPRFGNGVTSDSITVANCIIDGLTIGVMAYSAGKCRPEESVNAIQVGGTMLNAYDNVMMGTYNGLATGDAADSSYGSYSEYSYNLMNRITDDCFEVDGASGVNTLALKNDIRASGSGWSNVPSGANATPSTWRGVGPYYLMFNTLATRARGIKMGGANTAVQMFYHNTFYPDPVLSSTLNLSIDATPGGQSPYQYFRNNLFVSTAATPIPVTGLVIADSLGMQSGRGPGPSGLINLTQRDSASWTNWSMDADRYALVASSNVGTWWGVARSRAAMTTAWRWEKTGGNAFTTTVALESPSTYDFRYTSATTAGPDGGRRLTGVNAAWGITRYVAHPQLLLLAPDAGAYEYGFPATANGRRRHHHHYLFTSKGGAQ